MELNPERFSLAKAIGDACTVVKGTGQKKRIQLNVNVSPVLETVTLDQQKFKQVLFNLLSNAIKFTDEGGQVTVSAAPSDGGRFQLEVTDTGIGIRPEDLSRLFVEFSQLDTGTSRQFEGTGLGLALTKKIVEIQGGAITVESAVGKGSTFAVRLPLVATGGNS